MEKELICTVDIDSNCPLVSVVVPVYNQKRFLGETLLSLRGQTYSNMEIICVDDGSTDGTHEILQASEMADSRMRIIYQQHQLAGVARNRGLDSAQGKYIIFLDSDDLFEKNMIELMVSQAERYSSDVVICRADSFFSNGEYRELTGQLRMGLIPAHVDVNDFSICRDLPQYAYQVCCGWAWDKLFRTDYLRRYGFRFGHMRHAEDALLAYPATIFASRASIVSPDTPLLHYRQSENQLSSAHSMGSAPLAFFESADMMIRKMRELMVPEQVMNSMKIWFACYSSWSLHHLTGAAWVEYVRAVRRILEPRYQICRCVMQYLRNESYADSLREWHRSLLYYISVCSVKFGVPRLFHWYIENRECFGILGKSIYSITYEKHRSVHRLLGRVVKIEPAEELA